MVKAFSIKILWDDPQKHRRQREMQRRTSVRRNKGRECKRDEEHRHTFSITPHEKVFSTESFALWEQKERVRLQLYFIYPSSTLPLLLFIFHHTHTPTHRHRYRLREMTEANTASTTARARESDYTWSNENVLCDQTLQTLLRWYIGSPKVRSLVKMIIFKIA